MKTFVLALLALLTITSSALAQTPDYTLRIYPVQTPAATAPLTTATLPAASVTCNQAAPPATASTRNPNKIVWDDTANAGKVCVYTDAGTGPLLSTPTGFASLEATIAMISGGVENDESNRAPFSKTPAARTNVRLVR